MNERKILIVGNSPLPIEKGIVCQTAFGLRTFQFMASLQDSNTEALVIVLSHAKHYSKAPELNSPRSLEAFGKTFQVIDLDPSDRHFQSVFTAAYEKFQPDACIGVNIHGAHAIAQLKPKVPFWADLNGWSMAEAQSQSAIEQSDAYLPTIWKYERTVLKHADQISAVSTPQQHAIYGELATVGRMNQYTDEYHFVSHIPNANETHLLENPVADFDLRKQLKLSEDSFIIFFSGAYNTWLDSELIFEGIEKAMDQNASVTFVSTGGAAAVSNKTLNDFKNRIETSQHKDRFHFLGWIKSEELMACYQQVNLAINIDRPNHETIYGARNRINDWIIHKVPVLSTLGSEITHDLNSAQAMLAVEMNNSNDLAEKLLIAITSDLKAMAEKAFQYAIEHYSYKRTMRPLKAWLEEPSVAPDKGNIPKIDQESLIKKALFKVKNEGLGNILKKIWKRIR